MSVKKLILLAALLIVVGLVGCEAMKFSAPIVPVAEYEAMIVGRLDANYVGTDRCLAACHDHDRIRQNFEASTMGAQLSSESGMPLVDCESCHGPGSLAIEGITKEKVAEDAKQGIHTKCNYDTLLDLKTLPPTAQSLICLRCHTANATFNLHNWNSGIHAVEDVTCSNCHDVHAGADLITSPRHIKDMCLKCHKQVEAEFSLRSHHPVKENKVFCNDCHDPHDTINDKLKREDTIKETCTKCHAEYAGPFTFEHADLNENCLRCHKTHGSPNRALLVVQETFLCLQCHLGHRTSGDAYMADSKKMYYTRCTDCHSSIHGSDLPSTGKGSSLTN